MSNSLYLEAYRVYTRPEFVRVYQRLRGLVYGEYHSLFSLCTFIGFKNNRRVEPNSRKELFWSRTFSSRELAGFYALIVLESEKGNYELLKDGEKALSWLQGYADGGLQFLLESGLLKSYVVQKVGELDLDVSTRDNLQKKIMGYVFDEYRTLSSKYETNTIS